MLQLPRLGHMLPRLLALLSLQRNADKLVMRSGTPRKSSKGSTEMVRGNGTGRELDSKLLHLRHLLLSPLPHLMLHLILDLRHDLLTSLLHLRHLLLSPFRFKILMLLVRLYQTLAHLLDLHLLPLPHFLVTSHLHLQHLVPMLLVPMLHLDLAHLLDLHLRHLLHLPHLLICSSPWFPQGRET